MNYTARQLKVLDTIYDYTKQNRYSPTLGELAEVMQISVPTVFEHISALEKKSAVTRRIHESRSIEIIDREYLITKGFNVDNAISILKSLKEIPNDQPIPINIREKLNAIV